MNLSSEDLAAIEAIVVKVVSASMQPAPPVVVDPIPAWTRPADLGERLGYTGDIAPTRDYAEARRRALYGYTYAGSRALVHDALLAAWREVDAIKSLTQETVRTYRRGIYAYLDPDLAAFLVLTGVIDTFDTPLMAPKTYAEYAGQTVETFLDAQWGMTGGPSGGDI